MAEAIRGGLSALVLRDVRGYRELDATFGPGPQLVWGPNAAGKTSLLEAIVVLAWARSHRTSTDAELIRWGADVARIEGRAGDDTLEVVLVRSGSATALAGAGRKRVRVNGVGRRSSALPGFLRTVVFAPEEMLLVAGSPSLRRAAVDQLTAQRSPAYGADLSTYGRALQQRNAVLRSIREERSGSPYDWPEPVLPPVQARLFGPRGEPAGPPPPPSTEPAGPPGGPPPAAPARVSARDQLRLWDEPLLEAGGRIVEERLRTLEALAGPLAAAHAEIAPDEASTAALAVRYATNAPPNPGETARQALARRLRETADKEVWNGATLVGPHRDDLVFELGGRDLAGFASRGQQRTAILAFKLAELDLLASLGERPPLLLLDDVFSELDPDRRAHLVRRIAALPQAFITTTTPDDLDPALVAISTGWQVRAGEGGAGLLGPTRGGSGTDPGGDAP